MVFAMANAIAGDHNYTDHQISESKKNSVRKQTWMLPSYIILSHGCTVHCNSVDVLERGTELTRVKMNSKVAGAFHTASETGHFTTTEY